MRVTIDLDRDIIIVPDNFFKKIAEENEKLIKYGGNAVAPVERIKKSYDIAIKDTDTRLMTQSTAKTSTRSKKTMTPEEARRMLEAEAAKVGNK